MKTKTYSPLVLLALTLPTNSVASEPNLDGLIARSSLIAVVRIEEAKLIFEPSPGCGTFYKGLVVESFKGAIKDKRVSFRVTNQYLVGWQYLIFASNRTRPRGTNRPDMDLLHEQSEDCAETGTANTVIGLSAEYDYSAIFERRTVTEIGEAGRRQFYVGPSPAMIFFAPRYETHVFREHRPIGPVLKGAVLAEVFENILRERIDTSARDR